MSVIVEAVVTSPAGAVRDQPIRAISSANFTDEPNRITRWSLDMPRSDARALQVSELDTIVVEEVLGGQRVEFVSGVVNEIAHVGDLVRLSGESLLSELRYRLLDGLRIGQTTISWADFIQEHNSPTGTSRTLTDLIYDSPGYANFKFKRTDIETFTALFFGMSHPFYGVDMVISAGNSVASEMQVQYWDGVKWNDVVNLTGLPSVPFGVGTTNVRWDYPSGWVAGLHKGVVRYYIRMFPRDEEELDLIRIENVELIVDSPTTNDVAPVLAYAPGWSLSGSYELGTAEGTRHEFQQESVFAALVEVAERSGELFRQGNGREIEWLGTGGVATGIVATNRGQATAVANDNAQACVIARLSGYSTTADDVVTRLYAYGAGTGDGRVTMAKADTSVDLQGFTLDREENCLINTALEASIGRREAVFVSRGVTAPRQSELDGAAGANELLKKTVAELKRRGTFRASLELELVGLPRRLRASDKITVDYQDSQALLTIFGDFIITRVVNRIASSGERTASVSLTADGKRSATAAETMAMKIRELELTSQYPQTISGRRVSGLTARTQE